MQTNAADHAAEATTATTRRWRRRQDAQGQHLLIKTVAWGQRHTAQRAQLRNHYLITSGLSLPGVARPVALQATTDGLVLTLPWTPGLDLASPQQRTRPTPHGMSAWGAALPIAHQLAGILADLADHGVVHGAVQPAHVLVDPASGQVSLLDFGQARFTRAMQSQAAIRPVDVHDDLRALGRMLCLQLLGHSLPEGDQQQGTATRQALQKAQDQGLPTPLHELLYRLLTAGAPGGYRHARAAQRDVARCMASAAALGTTLGQPPMLTLPLSRFGRESEVSILVSAYAEMAEPDVNRLASPGTGKVHSRPVEAPRIVMMNGVSGIGKTAVITDACQAMASHGANLASGKFNQYGDSRPLWALTQALNQLLESMRGNEGPRHQEQLRRLREALRDQAQVLMDVLPPLGRLLGPQPQPPTLSGEASRLRFEWLMRRLVGALSSQEHPLVLVLDDMQWADAMSLAMLRGLLRDPGIKHVLVLCAYRSEAVHDTHPLRMLLEALREDGCDLREVSVTPWTTLDIQQLIQTAGLRDTGNTPFLADLLQNTTQGNPLAVLWSLRTLVDEQCIRFDELRQDWQVDLAAAQAYLTQARPVELISRMLKRLPRDCQTALSTGAFLGASFSLETLAAAMDTRGNTPTQTLLQALWPALQQGLVQTDTDTGNETAWPPLKLAHDMVQQAAHGLISTANTAYKHAAIARALLANGPTDPAQQDHLFDVVRHFNDAHASGLGMQEREQVFRLNLAAGHKARASGAPQAALDHFEHALRLLQDRQWDEQPDLAFDAVWNTAEAAYLAANFARLDQLTQLLDQRASSVLDQARTIELRIQGLLARNRLAEGLAWGERALTLLDIKLESMVDPSQWPEVPREDNLTFDHPSTPRIDTALRVLVWLTPCAYITSFEMYARVILTMVKLASASPSSPLTAISFTNYGLTLCGMGRPAEGFAAGELALALSQRQANEPLRCKVWTLTYGFLRHWKLPAADALQPMLATVQDCLLCGDQEYVGYASFLYCDKAWGLAYLPELERIHSRHTTLVSQMGHAFSWRHCQVWLQFLQALTAAPTTGNGLYLRGSVFDERTDLAQLETASNHFSLFTAHVLRAVLAWHRGEAEAALKACRTADNYAMTAVATLLSVDHAVLCVLCELHDCHDSDLPHRAAALERAESRLAQLTHWAQQAPANVAHKLALAQAVYQQTRGEHMLAWQSFEQAALLADATTFLHDQALIADMAGRFYAAQGQVRLARDSLYRAYDRYLAWGALPVAESLLQRHSALLVPSSAHDDTLVLQAPRPGRSVGLNLQDKLSALLQEFGLNRVVVALDGAATALVSELQPGQTPSLMRVPLSKTSGLPLGLLALVRQSASYTVVRQPAQDLRWQTDPYFANHRPGTVAAWPVQRGQQVIGGMVLEADGDRLLAQDYLGDRMAWYAQAIVDELRAESLSHQLQESMLTDALTGLPNRAAFVRQVDLTLARMRNLGERHTAVAVLQIRNFEDCAIVDGQDHGDALLRELALRLSSTAKAAGSVAVLGRSRLGLLYWGLGTQAVLNDCRYLHSVIDGPYLGDLRIPVETDLVVCADDGQLNAASALRDAENALAVPLDRSTAVFLFDRVRLGLDVQARERAEARLRNEAQLRALAEKRNQEKSWFIASAVHDLRQPLQAIGTVLEPAYLAVKEHDLNTAERLLDVARKSSRLMRDQLNAILDISRLESGLTTACYGTLDLGQLLARAQELTQSHADSQQVCTRFQLPHQGTVAVHSDPELLQRLLLNLLNNAIKYRAPSPAGGAWVDVGTLVDGSSVTLMIRDNGIGIAQELIDGGTIFEPFFQAAGPRLGQDKGVGLGLAIVKVILGLLPDHTLSVESSLGKGTCFNLRIPRASTGAVTAHLAAEGVTGPANMDLSHLYVLVVEDDALVLQAIEALLSASHALYASASSLQALEVLVADMERVPDVLLTDFRLPSGFTAVEVVACVTDCFGPVPTVLMTGEPQLVAAAASLAGLPLLHKPIDPGTLLQALQDAASPAGS